MKKLMKSISNAIPIILHLRSCMIIHSIDHKIYRSLKLLSYDIHRPNRAFRPMKILQKEPYIAHEYPERIQQQFIQIAWEFYIPFTRHFSLYIYYQETVYSKCNYESHNQRKLQEMPCCIRIQLFCFYIVPAEQIQV